MLVCSDCCCCCNVYLYGLACTDNIALCSAVSLSLVDAIVGLLVTTVRRCVSVCCVVLILPSLTEIDCVRRLSDCCDRAARTHIARCVYVCVCSVIHGRTCVCTHTRARTHIVVQQRVLRCLLSRVDTLLLMLSASTTPVDARVDALMALLASAHTPPPSPAGTTIPTTPPVVKASKKKKRAKEALATTSADVSASRVDDVAVTADDSDTPRGKVSGMLCVTAVYEEIFSGRLLHRVDESVGAVDECARDDVECAHWCRCWRCVKQ
jgi:hypothetical protein